MTDATTTTVHTAGRKYRGVQGRKDRRLAYALIVPAALLELLIHIIPMVLGLYIAFIELDQRTLRNWLSAPFIWFDNFARSLEPTSALGSQFFDTLGRTALYVVLVLAFSWALAMAGAVFLQKKFRGQGLLRTLFLVPYAVPLYVGCIAWAFMFNQRDGVVNQLIFDVFGASGDRTFWLIGDNAFFVLVIVSVWSYWPFAFLMLMAALQNVPDEVYEAASIDGAGPWKQFVSITLPMIRPANAALLLMLGLWMFNQFNIPYVLFGPSSPDPALLVSPLIYQNSFQNWDFGAGAAMSALLLLALLVVSIFYIRLVFPKGTDSNDA
ncbi:MULTISPECIES: carbohydrate ABC transporter permease [Microbacterium]|uniref:carbohydrate ABC transporter permease n=1 Tax=Microbacterium TaxID=33882 RepID=UPI0012B96B9E|nr:MULTISPECIES: sugar ABC transporter permease [Microbacterium]MTE23010.1 ABC transporter permease subunit [Microbacterium sp. ZXX196]NHI16314.1 sugar ABC transporter permease [Microbacterium excoecariae]